MGIVTIALALGLTPCGAGSAGTAETAAKTGAARPGLGALDYGFKFASAIETDPKSKGGAQAGIVLAYLKLGALDLAMNRAGSVEGFWRGVALAEVAAKLAVEGRDDEAREFVRRAEEVRNTISGWENPRISSHVAHALALLGDLESTREAAKRAADDDPREYTGQAVATVAEGYADQGDFDQAMAELAVLEGDKELMTTWWRTAGYLEIARKKGLTDEQRTQALEAAAAAAKAVPGWRQVDALRLVGEELHAIGKQVDAVSALDAAEEMIGPAEEGQALPPMLLTDLAGSWAKVGEKARAARLLEQTDNAILRLPIIDQPGLYARVAMVYLALEDRPAGRRALDTALSRAEALTNARPRALAVVEVCRQIGVHDLALSVPDRSRLDTLFAGLRAPW